LRTTPSRSTSRCSIISTSNNLPFIGPGWLASITLMERQPQPIEDADSDYPGSCLQPRLRHLVCSCA
jgi:hypothetical protein